MEPLSIFVSVCLLHIISREKEVAFFFQVTTVCFQTSAFGFKYTRAALAVWPEDNLFGPKLSLWTATSQISTIFIMDIHSL